MFCVRQRRSPTARCSSVATLAANRICRPVDGVPRCDQRLRQALVLIACCRRAWAIVRAPARKAMACKQAGQCGCQAQARAQVIHDSASQSKQILATAARATQGARSKAPTTHTSNAPVCPKTRLRELELRPVPRTRGGSPPPIQRLSAASLPGGSARTRASWLTDTQRFPWASKRRPWLRLRPPVATGESVS